MLIAGWDKSLQISMLLSGSVHLGLFALVVAFSQSKANSNSPVDISLVEFSSPHSVSASPSPSTPARLAPARPTQVVETQTPDSSSALVETASPSESTENEVSAEVASELSGSSSTGKQAVTAQERYIASLTRLLNSKKKYPEMARKLRQQGRVIVRFRLNRDGSVLEASIENPSSYQLLNQSAQALIQNLKGLDPFPQEIQKTTWLFSVPIDYQM